LNVENEKLKTLMRELYVEALNTETEWFYFVRFAGATF
jgi:hypothetical protein